MSVLAKIESGTFAVCKYHEWDSGDYYTKEPEATGELLRLARLGSEAEKAIQACFKQMQRYEKGDGCVWQFDDNCEF